MVVVAVVVLRRETFVVRRWVAWAYRYAREASGSRILRDDVSYEVDMKIFKKNNLADRQKRTHTCRIQYLCLVVNGAAGCI